MSEELKQYESYYPVKYDYVDQLPTGWQLLPNIAIFEERIERGHIKEELLSVTIKNGVIKQTDVEIKKDSSNEDKSKYKLVKEGDIAINKMRMWQGALGYSEYQGIVSPAYIILKPKMKINSRFFHYMLRSSFYINYSKRYSYGIVDDQLSLRYTHFKRMYSIFPPIEIQNAVVDYLDKKNEEIDLFIKKKYQLIDVLREKKNRSIENLVTKGVDRTVKLKNSENNLFGQVPVHWKVKKLRYVAKSVKTGTTPSSKAKNYFDDANFNWFTPSDFNEDYLLIDSDRKVNYKAVKDKEIPLFPARSVLIIGIGGTLGKVGIILDNASSNQQINAIVFNKEIVPIYGLHLLAFVGRNLINLLDYTTLPILNQSQTKDILFLAPPITEQKMIIEKIESISEITKQSIMKIENEILAINKYRESLITNLITGQKAVPI